MTYSLQQKSGFTVAYQFANIARQRVADKWPATTNATWKEAKAWFPNLHEFLTTRLMTLGNYCVICDDQQPISGQISDTCLV